MLPRWRWTARVALLTSGVLAVSYTLLVVLCWGQGEGSMSSLAGVQMLLASDWITLYAWIHYLAFDLWVGAWEVRDARRLGLHHGLVVPCLVLTLMLGPCGLLLYLTIRGAVKRRVWLASTR